MDPYRLPRTVVPHRYDLRLDPDLVTLTFTGTGVTWIGYRDEWSGVATVSVDGGEVEVPTPKGTKLALRMPPETQNGRKIRLANQGMPHLSGNGRGDLYAEVSVVLPTHLSDEERGLFQRLAELRERLRPVLLRRTRASVMRELPERTTEVIRIAPTDEQVQLHGAFMQVVSAILNKKFLSEMDLDEFYRSSRRLKQMLENPESFKLGGVNQTITILFADIRGFTRISEHAPAEKIVGLLNRYFSAMTDIIFAHGGTLDKYVGDEIIGLFGAPVQRPDAPVQAVRCALEMQRALEEFNRMRESNGSEPIHVGIGVNTGPVIAGAIGSSRTLQYTVIGDAVNIASRAEPTCATHCAASKGGSGASGEAWHPCRDVARDQSPNQRARLAAPYSCFSAVYSRDASWRCASAAGPLRKSTSTLLTSPSPNSA